MKKVKSTGKLSLNKETITKLSTEQLSKLVGGTATQVYTTFPRNGISCCQLSCA